MPRRTRCSGHYGGARWKGSECRVPVRAARTCEGFSGDSRKTL